MSVWLLLAVIAVPCVALAQGGRPAANGLVSISLANSHLGNTYVGAGGLRYFVAEVMLTNHSGRNLNIPIASLELLVDGSGFRPDVKHPKLTGYEFRVNGKSHRFRDLEQTERLPLSDGTSASAWVVFTDLPKTQTVPKLELRLELEDVLHTFDVNGHYEAKLKLQLQRIGPHDALALLTIGGRLNTISVGTLVETIDQLAAAHVLRVVVAFNNEAGELDEPLGNWLRQTAQGVQTGRTYAMFPAVVSTVREFHVADLPGQQAKSSESHVHDSTAAAVEHALASVYRNLRPEEIVAEIENGHRLSQASALVSGGADLPPESLPLLLERAVSEDRLLRRGAFIALSGSGDTAAIQTLVKQAAGSDKTAAALAVECLAASRYAGAHEALSKLLESPLAIDQTTLVQTLATFPRQPWMGFLSRLATDDGSAAGVRREAVLALGKIGHPQLTEILSGALESRDDSVRKAAFSLLLTRADADSDAIALEHALGQLAQGPPTPQMLQLFDRVRDPRIAPRLIPLLDDGKRDRTALINTLARIGLANIGDELADRFAAFKPNEQAAVIANLTQLRSKRLLPLAKQGLLRKEDVIFNAAVRALTLTADDDAVRSVADRLNTEENIARVNNLAKALEGIGTPVAIRALEAATKTTDDDDKRSAIAKHLQALQLKSPGGQHFRRAERYAQEEQHEKAIEHYTFALDRDPDLSPAYSGRGHARLKLEQYKQAEADFRNGIELDPDDGLAVAGLGIALAIEGDVDEAVKTVEEASDRFPKDLLFAYNAACVYGRALESVSRQPASAEQADRQKRYRKAALSLLAKSIELGFSDRDWITKDPDLTSLRGLEEFQKLVGPPAEESEDMEEDEESSRDADDPQRKKTFSKPMPGEQ